MAHPRLTRIVIVVGLLTTTVGAAFVVLVPRWIKAKIIAAAAAHGVALTISDLSIAPGRARLKGVHAAPLIRSDAKTAPKIEATAATVDVDLDLITPTGVTVTAAVVELDGAATVVHDVLAARDRSTGGGKSTITRVTLTESTFIWKHVVSSNLVSISAAHVNGDVTVKPGRALGDDWHFETTELRAFDTPKAPAWAATIDGDAIGTRSALTLPKNAHVTIDYAASGARTIDVNTPNVTVGELGMPSGVLGLYGDETSRFEIHLHHQQTDLKTAQGTFVGTASDVFIGASTARTDLAIDARYAGDPSTSLKLTAATLRAGPFTGSLEGGFVLDGIALKASLRYSSGVMSCIDAVKSQAANYGALGKGVAALAGALGFDRAVEGRVMLKGEMDIDTRTNTNRFAFRTEGDCKLSYLPAP